MFTIFTTVRRIEEFKNEKIIPHIVQEEATEGNFLKYIYAQDVVVSEHQKYGPIDQVHKPNINKTDSTPIDKVDKPNTNETDSTGAAEIDQVDKSNVNETDSTGAADKC